MLRSVEAVVAGYAVMVVLVMLGTVALVAAMVPGGVAAMRQRGGTSSPMPVSYLVSNIALSLAAAVVGGWTTLRLALRAPTSHLVALGVVLVLMGLVSARMPEAQRQPAWYRMAIPVVGLIGIALSALFVPHVGGA